MKLKFKKSCITKEGRGVILSKTKNSLFPFVDESTRVLYTVKGKVSFFTGEDSKYDLVGI